MLGTYYTMYLFGCFWFFIIIQIMKALEELDAPKFVAYFAGFVLFLIGFLVSKLFLIGIPGIL